MSLIAAASGIIVLALAVATTEPWVAWAGLGVLVVAIGAGTLASMGFIDGDPDRTGLWARLARVHPDFVESLEARGQVPADV